MNDDFDPIEDFDEDNGLDDIEFKNQNKTSLKEKYDNLQENKEKWQNRYDKTQDLKNKFNNKTGATNGLNNSSKKAGNKLGKSATKGALDSANSNIPKSAAKSAAKSAGNSALSSQASSAAANAGIRNASKMAAKKGAQTAAKAGAKTAVAAGTGGASVAVDAGLKAAKAVGKGQKKLLSKFDKLTGLKSEKHQTAINITSILLLPLVCCICICTACSFTQSTTMTNQTVTDALNEAIEKTLVEVNKDATNKATLLTMKDKDKELLEKNIYEIFRDKNRQLYTLVEGLILKPGETDSDKSQTENGLTPDIMQKEDKSELKGSPDNIAKEFSKFITPYLFVEKENFNKIQWTGVDCSNGTEFEIKTKEDGETKLKIPENKSEISEDQSNDMYKLAEEYHPYLEQWVIPVSNYLVTIDRKFLDTFMDEMLHEVVAKKLYIYKYETKTTRVYKVETQQVDEKDEEGNIVKKTVPKKDANGGYIKSLISTSEGKEQKSLKEVKNIVDTSKTFWGIIKNNPTIKSKDPASKVESTETGSLKDDFTIEEITTTTYTDTVETKKETEEYKLWKDGQEIDPPTEEKDEEEKEKEKNKYPITFRSSYVLNSPSYIEKHDNLGIASTILDEANTNIKKYHEDAYIQEKMGSYNTTLIEKDKVSFIWPIKEDKATAIRSWYKEGLYSEDKGLTIVTNKKDNEKYEVVATASGKINYVRTIISKEVYSLEILHENGYKTVYTNITNLPEKIKANAEVQVGEVIGEMASGSEENELMLKYSIYKVNQIINPFEFYLYTEENSEQYKKVIRKFEGLKSTTTIGNGTAGVMVMSEDWNRRIAAMIDEAIIMEEERKTIYSQANRQLFVDYRQTSADCSSWCATMYYRFFDHAKIGTYTGDQYPMTAVSGINAMKVENYVDANGNIDTTKLMPGDLIYRNPMGNGSGYPHVIMYVGGYKGMPDDAYIHHGSGYGPKLGYFNKLSAQGKKEYSDYYAIRYYRDGDIVSTGGTAGGGFGLDGIEKGSMADSPLVNKVISNYGDSIKKWSTKFGIDPGVVVGMICQESGGNPSSYNGYAMGLMQIEHVHWGQTIVMEFADGSSEKTIVDSNKLYNPDYNIMIGCWEFSTQIKKTYGNIAVAIQGYNYGSGGIRRCIGYHLSGGANTGSTYCGMTEGQFKQYCESGDIGWLEARKWYSSVGHRKFGGGAGTPTHLEYVLRYYKQF